VLKAKGLASAIIGKVRDVVSRLREAARSDLKEGLEALAQSIPVPAVHIDMTPGVEVSPDRAHALLRCAQEAVTDAIKHADAKNLWLQVRPDWDLVRLIAYNDGRTGSPGSLTGSDLTGGLTKSFRVL
jgi:signal transduction histidine kinase